MRANGSSHRLKGIDLATAKVTDFRPVIKDIHIPEKPQPARHVFGAVTNLPPVGTFVRCTLQGWEVVGVVSFPSEEHGAFHVIKDVWIDGHGREDLDIRISVKAGWKIELLDIPPLKSVEY